MVLLALGARAVFAQEFPRLVAVLVAVVPLEADGVLTDRRHLGRPGGAFEDGELAGLWLDGRADGAAALGALFVAVRTGAGIAQPLESVVALVAVFPGDVHARAGGHVHLHGFGIS